MPDTMPFPTMEQVEHASREQLAYWYRHLVPFAEDPAEEKKQQKIMGRITARFKDLGGMTPKLSKKVGF